MTIFGVSPHNLLSLAPSLPHPSLSLADVPNAFPLLEDFAAICIAKGIFTENLLAEMPERGRKRFVSEGDGGLIKDHRFVITEPVLA